MLFKTPCSKHLVLHLGPKYLSVILVSWNKDFQLAINCLQVVISGGLPIAVETTLILESDWIASRQKQGVLAS